MSKKIISIITAMLLVFALLPFSAFAAQVSTIEIRGFSNPVVGELPDYDVALDTEGCSFDYYYWFKIENGSPVVIYNDGTTRFEEEVQYFMYFVVKADDGSSFADNATVKFLDDAGNELHAAVLYYYSNMYYIYSPTLEPVPMNEITAVAFENYVEPKDGMTVADLDEVTTDAEGCDFSAKWLKDGSEFNGTFAAGNTYTFEAALDANYGTRFMDASVTLNGEPIEVEQDDTHIAFTVEVAITDISVVTINKIYDPVEGVVPDEHPGLSVPANAPYSIVF